MIRTGTNPKRHEHMPFPHEHKRQTKEATGAVTFRVLLFIGILAIVFTTTMLIGKLRVLPCTSDCNENVSHCRLDGISAISKCTVRYDDIPNKYTEEYSIVYLFVLPVGMTTLVYTFVSKIILIKKKRG
jgi:hypothetical protein